MKILKPGKVEQRKFVCPNCECEFVVFKSETDRTMDLDRRYHYWAKCPCRELITWDSGEPYEEPTPTQTGSNAYEECLSEIKSEFMEEFVSVCKENGIELELAQKQTDRERMFDLLAGSRFWFEDNAAVLKLTDFLIANGVTFREG